MNHSGFTLVELLALGILLLLISFLVLPTLVRAQQRASRITCQSNLKQIGLALQAYAADNNDLLPGPLSALVASRYDQRSTNQLGWFIAGRIGSARPAAGAVVARVLLCPTQAAAAGDRGGATVSYTLNQGRGVEKALPGAPFGRLAPVTAPMRLSCVATSTVPALCWAIADADKGDVNPTLEGWGELPYQPVHGQVRNQLYFDWHVDAKRW